MDEASGLEFVIHREADGRYHWRLQSANGRVVAVGSPTGYAAEQKAQQAIERVRRQCPGAPVKMVGYAPPPGA